MNTNRAPSAQGKTTPEDIAAFLFEVETRTSKATPGPWHQGHVDKERVFAPYNEGLAGYGGKRVVFLVNMHFPTCHDDAQFVAHTREDVPRLVAIIREQRDRLARAESAELALLDLRRVMQSNFEPANELGAELLVQSVVERLDRLAKLEAALSDMAMLLADGARKPSNRIDDTIERLRELLEEKDGS